MRRGVGEGGKEKKNENFHESHKVTVCHSGN